MSLFNLSKNIIYPSIDLPLTLISLEKWSVLYINGIDSKNFLQTQLTIDMNLLEKYQYKICAYCNLNGKVHSTMLLFHYQNGYACIIKKSLSDLQIKIFKKYSIFSKVQISELKNIILLGISGKHAKLFLSKQFKNIPNSNFSLVYEKETTILKFDKPCERFLLVLSFQNFLLLQQQINIKIALNNSKQWMLLDMESGYPIIGKTMSQKFLPQSINLDKIQAINFHKGCYYGQEMIAQVHYKKLNKHALYLLSSKGKIYPKIGSVIKIKMCDQWLRIGFLLAIVHVHVNEIWIQTVLHQSIQMHNVFRISGFKNIFLLKK